MGSDPYSSPGREPGDQAHRQQLWATIEADRADILAAYQQRLRDQDNPIANDSQALEQALAHASQIITDMVVSTQSGGVVVDDRYKLLAWTIGESRAESGMHSAESLHAAAALFDVTVDTLARHVGGDPGLLPGYMLAIRALNESITRRLRAGSLAYSAYLLERVHRAHTEERQRIARDLHDYLGEALSLALRQLEQHEIAARKLSGVSFSQSRNAKDALGEAMLRLRAVTSDLRRDVVTNLEKALVNYIESAATQTHVQLRVSGDETWAPPAVIDEAFLIIREAIKNALTHASPRMVLIGVALAPDELSAWIDDDGRGFIPSDDTPADGIGLTSMRERAALLAGRLSVKSVPGHGTHVELHVPLPWSSDA